MNFNFETFLSGLKYLELEKTMEVMLGIFFNLDVGWVAIESKPENGYLLCTYVGLKI